MICERGRTCGAILTTGWRESISRSALVPPFLTPDNDDDDGEGGEVDDCGDLIECDIYS